MHESVVDISRRVVSEFLDKTSIPVRSWTADPDNTTERRVCEVVETWNLGDVPPQRRNAYATTSIKMATTAFAHTHRDIQVHIALFTVLGLCIDDLEIKPRALEEFVHRLQTGAGQLHPVLHYLSENLQQLPKYFPPYTASAIFAATVQFVNSTLFDRQSEGMRLTAASLPYVQYKRARNSLAEVYGFYVWDKFNFPDVSIHIQVISDAMIYQNHVNDILSFYKEELAGETANFVHDRAMASGKTVSAVLSELVEEVVLSVERARMLLNGDKERDTWERFMTGWVAFHFQSPRYRLNEIMSLEYTS